MNQNIVNTFGELAKQITDKNIFFSPNIPAKKIKNAIAAYANAVQEKDVLLLIDNTAFGGAKDGVLITSDRIYAHNMAENPRSIGFGEVKQIMFIEGITSKWHINDAPFAEFNFPDKEALRKVTQAIRQAAAVVARSGPTVEAPAAEKSGTEREINKAVADPVAANNEAGTEAKAGEEFPIKVNSKNEAKQKLAAWQAQFPARKSLYAPSGKTSLPALLLMMGGGVISLPVSLIVLFLAMHLEMWLIDVLVQAVDWVTNGYGGIFPVYLVWTAIFPIIGMVIVILAALFSLALVTAISAGGFVHLFGRLGKNRNVGAGAVITAVSVCIAFSLPFIYLYSTVSADINDLLAFFGIPEMDDTFYLIMYVINFIAGIVLSIYLINNFIKEAKFCEKCRDYMKKNELAGISRQGLQHFMESANKDVNAESLKNIKQAPGQACTPVLFTCKGCTEGYLEPKVNFNALWMEKDKKGNTKQESMVKSWIAGSYKLKREEVKSLI